MNLRNILVMLLLLAPTLTTSAQELRRESEVTAKSKSAARLHLGARKIITACVDNLDAKGTCRTAVMPALVGEVRTIKAIPSTEGAFATWFAFADDKASLCAIKEETSEVLCLRLVKIAALLSPSAEGQSSKDLQVRQMEAGIAARAILRAASLLSSRMAVDGGVVSPTLINVGGGCTYDEETGNTSCDEGGGGNEGGGGCGDCDSGGPGDDAGGDTGDGQTIPPGTAPADNPQRASCMAAAYRSWTIMDAQVCSKISNPSERSVCNEVNMRDYVEELAYCNATY